MSDWPLELLGVHSDVRARIGWRGLSSDEYTDDGPYLIAGKHLVNDKIDWQSCDHVSQWRYEESPEIALRVGDVVVSKDGTIGRVGSRRCTTGSCDPKRNDDARTTASREP